MKAASVQVLGLKCGIYFSNVKGTIKLKLAEYSIICYYWHLLGRKTLITSSDHWWETYGWERNIMTGEIVVSVGTSGSGGVKHSAARFFASWLLAWNSGRLTSISFRGSSLGPSHSGNLTSHWHGSRERHRRTLGSWRVRALWSTSYIPKKKGTALPQRSAYRSDNRHHYATQLPFNKQKRALKWKHAQEWWDLLPRHKSTFRKLQSFSSELPF